MNLAVAIIYLRKESLQCCQNCILRVLCHAIFSYAESKDGGLLIAICDYVVSHRKVRAGY